MGNGLLDNTLDWVQRTHGKSFVQDKKGTLQVLLYDLEMLIDEVHAVLEDHFVAMDMEEIQDAGVEPLVVPNKLATFLGGSFILQSEIVDDKESLKAILPDDEDFLSEDDSFDDDDPMAPEDEEGAYVCAKCSSVHESYDELAEHLQTCCNSGSPSKSSKKPRAKRPIEDRTCKHCSKTFSTQHYLKHVHSKKCDMATGDPHKDYVLKCPDCSKVYKCVSHYYLHIKTCGHAETKFENVDRRTLAEVSCHKCGFIAESKEELQTLDHKCEPIKLFKCLKCDFEGYDRSSVRYHDLRIHQKDKALHVCDICGATFSHKYGITRHLKTHLERAPCPKCGKTFCDQSSLNRHIENFHKPAQKHPCEICGKTFSMLRYLKRHITSQHPESGELEKHECTHCHSSFREKAYLKKHIRKKHSNL